MKNFNDKDKNRTDGNAHPTPNADPGAEIETVIPNGENEATPAESSGDITEDDPETTKENTKEDSGKPEAMEESSRQEDDAEMRKEQDTEEADEAGTSEEKTNAVEIPEDEENENNSDNHGIETVSP